MPQKCSFQDTFIIEENNHSDNVKKKKNNFKTEADKSVARRDAMSNYLDKVVSPESSKLETSKTNSLFKVKFTLNSVNNNNKTTELETNNDIKMLETAKTNRNTTKSITSLENKSTRNSVDEPSNKLKTNNNLMTPKSMKSESDTPIETKSVFNNRNNNDVQTNSLEISDDTETLKTSIPIIPDKTKYRVKSINKNCLRRVARKRGYHYLLKETQQPSYNNHENKIGYLFKKSSSGVLKKYKRRFPTRYDNTKMLRSKPPKIKQKWSDKSNRNKLSNRILKSNRKFSKKKLNNCDSTAKKTLKVQKRKISRSEKLNIIKSLLDNSSNTCDIGKNLTSSIDKTQNCDAESIVTSIPVIESSYSCNSTIESSDFKPHSSKSTLHITSKQAPSTDNSPPSIVLPSAPLKSATPPSMSDTLPSSSTILPTSSTIPTTFTEVPSIVDVNKNNSQPHLMTNCSMNNTSYVPVAENEISYGINILSEAVIRQCNESINDKTTNSVEQSSFEINSFKHDNSSPHSKLPSAQVSSQKNNTNKPRRSLKRHSQIQKQSIETKAELRIDHELSLISKRFDIPIDNLKNTVINEPLAILQRNFSPLITPSMVTVSPIVQKFKTNSKDPSSKKLDVQFMVDPVRECKAYEKNNLKDLMAELSKTMPSWSLSITTDPPRYVISHTKINKYGAPFSNKSIVLDEYFRAYVYINQCLQNAYCKRYVTANQIVNLIKDLHSL